MSEAPQTLTVVIPLKVKRRGGRKAMLTPGGLALHGQQDITLIKAVARAFRWRRMLETGRYGTIDDLPAHRQVARRLQRCVEAGEQRLHRIGALLHPVQQHVHAADPQHGGVEVEAMEHAVMEVLAGGVVQQRLGMVVLHIVASGHQEAAGAAGRVHNHVLRPRRGHLHHQADDVARGAELPILAGGGDLAKHVLVKVALGVSVLHRHFVQHVHHLGQQGGGGDGEARILHVVRIGGAITAQRAQEGEDMFPQHGEHLGRREVPEPRPAQVLIGAAARVAALGEDAAGHGALQPGALALLQAVQVVQAADEEQVGELLDYLQRVGDAAGPEAVPDAVDLAAEVAGEHGRPLLGGAARAGQRPEA